MSVHIGAGYGSEYHLMRYMARYRNLLNQLVEKEVSGRMLEWLDFIPGDYSEYNTRVPCRTKLPDHEYVGVDFLQSERPDVLKAWQGFWPQTGNQQNWDSVGRVEIDGKPTWLLVEAKANLDELRSDCKAKDRALTIIESAFDQTRHCFGLNLKGDWKKKYYQYANRLATLYFLTKHRQEHSIPAKLLLIYFTGDKNPDKENRCPAGREGWINALAQQNEWVGLESDQARTIGVHTLFLHVVPEMKSGY
jgi:hypothetical protein